MTVGDYDGHVFLIVDTNGPAAYPRGEEYVIDAVISGNLVKTAFI